MQLKNLRVHHKMIFERLGINTEGKAYEQNVEELIHWYLQLAKEVEISNKEMFRRELYKVKTDRRN